jgi:GNAT superfamily N-acetyltransferase
MSRLDSVIAKPDVCTNAELHTFCQLVRQGGEVTSQGLEGRVKNARASVFLHVNGQVAGIAALKEPLPAYRDDVFQRAGVMSCGSLFALEFGWVFVLPDHRRNGYSRVLSEAALSQAKREPTLPQPAWTMWRCRRFLSTSVSEGSVTPGNPRKGGSHASCSTRRADADRRGREWCQCN